MTSRDWLLVPANALSVAASGGLPGVPDCSWVCPHCLRINVVSSRLEWLLWLGKQVPPLFLPPTWPTIVFIDNPLTIYWALALYQQRAQEFKSVDLVTYNVNGLCWVIAAANIYFHGHVAYIYRWFGVEFIDLSFPHCVAWILCLHLENKDNNSCFEISVTINWEVHYHL